jgi:hypothetical protein
LINPAFAKPKSLCSIAALLPVLFSLCALAFVSGATPDVKALDNPVAIFFMFLAALSSTLFVLPRALNWGWSTTYFFVGTLQLGSMALMGGIPWLCLLLYSRFAFPNRIILFAAYLLLIFLPLRKIIKMYALMERDKRLFDYVYQDSGGQTYFLQQNDTYLLEKKYKISLFPSGAHFVIFGLLGFSTVLFASPLSKFVGLPYPHIFIGILAIPIDIMAISFVIRGWFVFYHLPRILKIDGSTVYVDMASKTKF